MKKTSEFGKGTTYCLGLFLAHSDREEIATIKDNFSAELWFNASTDHLHELIVPRHCKKGTKERIKTFQDRCFKYRTGRELADKESVKWAIAEAKELLRLIDIECLNVKAIEAGWK